MSVSPWVIPCAKALQGNQFSLKRVCGREQNPSKRLFLTCIPGLESWTPAHRPVRKRSVRVFAVHNLVTANGGRGVPGRQLKWQVHNFKKERIHFGRIYMALFCPMKSLSVTPEQTCDHRTVAGGMSQVGEMARRGCWSQGLEDILSTERRSLETPNQFSNPKALLWVRSRVNKLQVRGKQTSWNQTWL